MLQLKTIHKMARKSTKRPRRSSRRPSGIRIPSVLIPSLKENILQHKIKAADVAAKSYGLSGIPDSYKTSLTKYYDKSRRFYGRGKYSLGSGIRDALKYTGRAKSLLGMGMYTGMGGYESTNALMSGSVNPEASYQTLDEEGALCITNHEYVSEIYANPTNTLFQNNGYSLNPGLENVFPWLSQIAQNYEEYEFKQCIFEYRSLVQDINSANGQVGSIIMATNYNPQAANFTDKAIMQAYAHANSFRVTDGGIHGVECDPEKLSGPVGRYIRTNPVLSGEDIKNYDHAKFQIAIHNTPSTMVNQSIGELWVTYKVVLRKPKLYAARGFNLNRSIYATPAVAAGSSASTFPFGGLANTSNWAFGQQNNIPLIWTPTSGNLKVTFPAYFNGDLEIILKLESDATMGGAMISGSAPVITGNVTPIYDIYASTNTLSSTSPSYYWDALTAKNAVALFHLRVRSATGGVDNSFTFNIALTGTTGNAIVQGFIDAHEYNSNFGNGADTPVWVNSSGGLVVV